MSHVGFGGAIRRQRISILFIVLVFGFSFLEDARAEDETRAKLIQRIGGLSDQRRFQEAIPLGEELVTRTKKVRGAENSEIAANIDRLAELYESADDYVRAEPLGCDATRPTLHDLERIHHHRPAPLRAYLAQGRSR
jgi:hypothetical protein